MKTDKRKLPNADVDLAAIKSVAVNEIYESPL